MSLISHYHQLIIFLEKAVRFFFNINSFILIGGYLLYNIVLVCHTSTWICHRYTRVPHLEHSSLLPPLPSLWVVPVHEPQASSIMHRTWNGNSFHIWHYTCFNAILLNHPTLSSPTESKRLLYTSASLSLSRIQGYHYHLSKFHIYALVYGIGVFLSGLLHSV